MSRDALLSLDDMRSACSRIVRYVEGMTAEAFVADEKTLDAVVRNLEIIGEASKHIPDSLKERLADVPWRKMTALRNILAHAYFGIDEAIVWDLASNHVPRLLGRLTSARP